METLRAKTPVFTDESGRRVTLMKWAARGLCACLVLVGATVGVTLATHVPLPGLGGIAPSAPGKAPEAAREATVGGESALDAGLTAGSDSAAEDGPRVARGNRAGDVSVRGPRDGTARSSTARPMNPVTARSAAQGAAAPSEGSGSVQPPAPQASPTASPASPSNPQAGSNASPHASAKSANSAARATPPATEKSKNPRATAAKSNGQASPGAMSTPPGWTK